MARPKKLPENNLTEKERQELVEQHLNLAYSITKKLCIDPNYFDDCYQEAVLGMVNASIYYQEDRGPFFAYARHECQCAIKDFLYKNRLIKISTALNTNTYVYYREAAKAEADKGDTLTANERLEIAKRCGINFEAFNLMYYGTLSLDYVYSDDGEDTLYDGLEDDSVSEFGNCMEMELILKSIEEFTATLHSRSPEYVEIFNDHLQNLINAEFTGTEKQTLTEIVKKHYTEFDIKADDDIDTQARKKKAFNSIYCSVQEFWKRNNKRLQEYLNVCEVI